MWGWSSLENEQISFDEKPFESWIEDLKSPDHGIRHWASRAFLGIYRLPIEKKRSVIPTLLTGTRNGDNRVRSACVSALRNLKGCAFRRSRTAIPEEGGQRSGD